MKNLNLEFTNREYWKMRKLKDEMESKRQQRISWEDFFLIKLLGTII